jgi:hypothetical protein
VPLSNPRAEDAADITWTPSDPTSWERDVIEQLDRLGVPRYVDGRPLTLLGRVDALLVMYEFERAADGR